LLAHTFGIEPDQALMVGDSRNDVEAAHAAGVRCVAVPYGYNHGEPIEDCQPDWQVESLSELL
jgi:phosphoglycolate phosphatase